MLVHMTAMFLVAVVLSCAAVRSAPRVTAPVAETSEPSRQSPGTQNEQRAERDDGGVETGSAMSPQAPAVEQSVPGRLVVTADVVSGTQSADGRHCRLILRVVSVDEKDGASDAAGIHPAESFEASTSCYTFMLHQMNRGGSFRFHIVRRAGGTLFDARVIGGLVTRPRRGQITPLVDRSDAGLR